ncbi:Protein of unknown function [Gryllus bimaculatus]|nr:Protein of unknown function [Gryllus bimaculatus]
MRSGLPISVGVWQHSSHCGHRRSGFLAIQGGWQRPVRA